MNIRNFILAITVAITSLLFVSPSTAQAKPAQTPWNKAYIEVTENLPSSWDVKGAAADLDWYTGSKIKVVSKCSGKYKCVNIRVGKVSGNPVGYYNGAKCTFDYDGWNDKTPTSTCPITVDTAKAKRLGKYGPVTKRWLVRHELGHWLTLEHNSKKCTSTMYQYVRCNSKVPPNTFTSAEQKLLRKQ